MPELHDLLGDVKDHVFGAQPVEVGGQIVWTFQVPGNKAFDTWEYLKDQFDRQGLWPVFTGKERWSPEQPFDLGEPLGREAQALLTARLEEEFVSDDEDAPTPEERERFVGPIARTLEEAQAHEHEVELPMDPWPAYDRILVVRNRDHMFVPSVYMALVPATTSYDAVTVLGFGGYNNCPTPEQQRVILRRWHEQYGLEAATVTGYGILEFVIERPPETAAEALLLATEHFAYCSDIVRQGCGSVPELATTLIDGSVWYFWWD